jgi:hypothetical protein
VSTTKFLQKIIFFQTANILSAVLCLLKELDYQSLEVVDNTVNARMNELMHEHTA